LPEAANAGHFAGGDETRNDSEMAEDSGERITFIARTNFRDDRRVFGIR
jgi:hypothetical protein